MWLAWVGCDAPLRGVAFSVAATFAFALADPGIRAVVELLCECGMMWAESTDVLWRLGCAEAATKSSVSCLSIGDMLVAPVLNSTSGWPARIQEGSGLTAFAATGARAGMDAAFEDSPASGVPVEVAFVAGPPIRPAAWWGWGGQYSLNRLDLVAA